MNSEEGVSLAKMAVTVLLVVLVIGAVVAIVYKAYSWFNSGSDKLGDQVTSIGSSSYSNYDDKNVKGTDVLTALKSFRDADFAVVISNLMTSKNGPCNPSDLSKYVTKDDSKAKNYCGLITACNGHAAVGGSTDDCLDIEAGSGTYGVDVDGGTTSGSGAKIWYKDGKFWCDNLHYTNGIADKNTNFSPTTDSSNTDAFVKQTGTFYSKLIYSEKTGDVCGVLFMQIE